MPFFARPHCCLPALLLAAGLAFAQPAQAEDGPLECQLTFTLDGWSAFYKTAAGRGRVRCSDGTSLRVRITSRGGGITFGRSRVDEGRGEFSGIYNIRDVLGRYATAEAHIGAGRATRAQVMTKGPVMLSLSGRGTGWDIGVSVGSFVLHEHGR